MASAVLFAALPEGAVAVRVGTGVTRSHQRRADAGEVGAYLSRLAKDPPDSEYQGDAR